MLALPLVISVIEATQGRMAAAFTEWERRYREEPERFMSEAEKLLKETPQSYGEACAPYFLGILQEQAGATTAPNSLTSTPFNPPGIGDPYKGGIYAGITLESSLPQALVLLPGDKTFTWQDATHWAQKQGGMLPSRVDALILWQNLPGEFEKDVYWTAERYAAAVGYAWCQTFNGGSQYSSHKSNELRARAVRRVPIK